MEKLKEKNLIIEKCTFPKFSLPLYKEDNFFFLYLFPYIQA